MPRLTSQFCYCCVPHLPLLRASPTVAACFICCCHSSRSALAEGGELATASERERLAARLAALPTSEAEDQALLDGGTVTGKAAVFFSASKCKRQSVSSGIQCGHANLQLWSCTHPARPYRCTTSISPATDWRQQAILQWRVQRKRALRQKVEQLAAAPGDEPQPPAPAEQDAQQAQQEGAAAEGEVAPRDEL